MVMAVFWLRKRNAIVLKYTEKMLTGASPYLADHEPFQHCILHQNAFQRTLSPLYGTLFTDYSFFDLQILSPYGSPRDSQHVPHLCQRCWCETHKDIFCRYRRKHLKHLDTLLMSSNMLLQNVASSFIKDVHSTLLKGTATTSLQLCKIFYLCFLSIPAIWPNKF